MHYALFSRSDGLLTRRNLDKSHDGMQENQFKACHKKLRRHESGPSCINDHFKGLAVVGGPFDWLSLIKHVVVSDKQIIMSCYAGESSKCIYIFFSSFISKFLSTCGWYLVPYMRSLNSVKSRMRKSCTFGSVRGWRKWPVYSTATIAHRLVDAGVFVSVMNPKLIKDYDNDFLRRVKSDRAA